MPEISDGKENGYFLKARLTRLAHGDCASPPVQPFFQKIAREAVNGYAPGAGPFICKSFTSNRSD